MVNRLQIPEGVSDFYGDTAYFKRKVEQSLRSSFLLRGYEEVETPSLEYFDTFKGEIGGIREEATVRFFDMDGRMLALRPDLTMPVARIAATRPRGVGALRYCYSGNAYGMQQEYGMKRREFTQAGCELLGVSGISADAELLLTAAESLLNLGIQDFVLDLGHVGYLREVCRYGNLTAVQTAAVAALIDEKNEAELAIYCREQGMDEGFAKQLCELIYLFGDESVFQRARSLFPLKGCLAIVDELEAICTMVRSMDLPFKISIDFAMAPNLNYYTGLVFRGMSPLLGYSLVSGGRYDTLMEQFGRPMPAIGFAMGVGNILHVLRSMGALRACPKADVLIGCGEGGSELLALAAKYRGEGKTVIISYAGDAAEFQAEAAARKPKKAVYYTAGTIAYEEEF